MLVPPVLKVSGVLIGTALVAAYMLIQYYPGTIGKQEVARYGEDDFTLDMYGWEKFEEDFTPWLTQQEAGDSIPVKVRFVSHKWFPAAHLDYYIARPLKLDLIGVGDLTDLHQYYWLNRTRDDLKPGDEALIVIPSNYPVNWEETYLLYFDSVDLVHTFPIERGGKIARYFRVYKAMGYKGGDEVHAR